MQQHKDGGSFLILVWFLIKQSLWLNVLWSHRSSQSLVGLWQNRFPKPAFMRVDFFQTMISLFGFTQTEMISHYRHNRIVSPVICFLLFIYYLYSKQFQEILKRTIYLSFIKFHLWFLFYPLLFLLHYFVCQIKKNPYVKWQASFQFMLLHQHHFKNRCKQIHPFTFFVYSKMNWLQNPFLSLKI